MTGTKSCEYCGEASQQSCKGCNIASYCNRSHQQEDWKRHKKQCKTIKLAKDDASGRYLVASRDINPGELLFTEIPIALGPRSISPLICLGCHNPITEDNFHTCPTCSWPVCSIKCSRENLHVQECQILQRDVKKCGVPQKQGETPRYDLILILRCLLLQASNPSAWRRLQGMESHLQRRKMDVEPYHVAAVRYLTEVCEVDSVDTVHHVRGAIITNCYETKGPSESSLRGVYPLLGLLNHSCIPNIALRADKSGKMYVRSVVSIKKGEMLTVAYTGTTLPVWERLQYTRDLHYFSCSCHRCQSSTELNTFFSSPRCPMCSNVPLLLSAEKDVFYCSKCDHRESMKDIIEKSNSTLAFINSTKAFEKKTIASMKSVLKTVEKTYHRKHYLWMRTAQTIIRLLFSHYDVEALELKKGLWEGLLSIFDVIEPGKTRRRGMTLLELGITAYALMEKESQSHHCHTLDTLKSKVEKLELINEAEEILQLEPPDSYELKWLERARSFLRKENRDIGL